MRTVSLGDVAECLDRLRVPVKESERVPGDVPYYGANGQQGWIDRVIFDEPLVIVAEDGGHFEDPSRGVAYRITGPAWVNNHGHVLRPTKRIDTNYLFQSLRNYDFGPYVSGSTRSKLTKSQLLRVEISLPPLGEQRRIAAILDQADALRAKRRQVLAHLDALTQSIFHDMFGTDDSVNVSLVEVADVTSGITKGRRTSEPTSLVPYLAVANVQAGHLRLEAVKEIEATTSEGERYALRDGDLLLTEGGDPDKLGRGTVWRNDLPVCIHQNHIFRVRIKRDAQILPDYLAAYIADGSARSYFLRSAKQTTGIASINTTQLKALPVRVPSMTLQLVYLKRLELVAHQRAATQRALAADDELFASLQARAFRGEL